ncbi:spike base protein, RCAP_Rcc01079 family [Sphingomonas panni]|uniref:spike base protein, RCAP_Rcc01079 family n=1 Tax=Sphingomonas panni TaxID=237612 RepID=UPI001F5B96F9|nr:hypothetical protein [Sphingomonas panni]
MPDRFGQYADTVTSPGTRATPVVPNDAADLPNIGKALYVGTGGTIVMRGTGGTEARTWKNVPDGALIPFRAQRILATGTTAADMLVID